MLASSWTKMKGVSEFVSERLMELWLLMVRMFVFSVAPFLMLSVAWPAWPRIRPFVFVQFEPGSWMLMMPWEVEL